MHNEMSRNGMLITRGTSGSGQKLANPTVNRDDAALRGSVRLLVAASWISGVIFALYIAAFFGHTALTGAGERWNGSLPGLYDVSSPLTTIAIGAHFFTGGVLLLLGPIQLIGRLRRNVPALHRWLGRLYIISAGLAGLGGLGFIFGKGTVGGPLMDIGFGLYGALMVLCAALAWVHAWSGQYEQHRAWAIRLFALTIGSWLYRMEYGLWHLAVGGLAGNGGIAAWFNAIMVFFFYVPNLIVAEAFIRARRDRGIVFTYGAAALLLAASVLVIAATWTFTASVWGPRTNDLGVIPSRTMRLSESTMSLLGSEIFDLDGRATYTICRCQIILATAQASLKL